MRVLMLSWEYPPKNIGGIAEHVYYLSRKLGEAGNEMEVHIVTSSVENAPIEEMNHGIHIHRVKALDIHTEDFVKYVMHLNCSIIERGIQLFQESGKFDIVHAHDWLCVYAACVLKGAFRTPMVATIHATEYGRNGGVWSEMQRYISQCEWKMCYEAWKIVVCSDYMKHELTELFQLPESKVWVIPNGAPDCPPVEEFPIEEFRRNYAKDDEKIIFFVGRHVYEKGIQLLIDSAEKLVHRYNIKFIVAGVGPMSDELKSMVWNQGLGSHFYFTGFIDQQTKQKIYRIADLAVFPSLYEPFGIVALEAMAVGCPVIVSATGGFNEIVSNRINGLKAYTNSIDSIVWSIEELLNHPELSKQLVQNGYQSIQERFNWSYVSELTMQMYGDILKEYDNAHW